MEAVERSWVEVEDLVVCFFASGPVAPARWSRLCERIASPGVRAAVLASIGPMELDAAARAQLGAALRAAPAPNLAVITDEALVRGTMTAMSWQTPVEFKIFPWHKLGDAHAYLRPKGLDAPALLELVERARRQVEG